MLRVWTRQFSESHMDIAKYVKPRVQVFFFLVRFSDSFVFKFVKTKPLVFVIYILINYCRM